MRRLVVIGVLFGLLAGTAQAAPSTPELEADYAAGLAWWGVESPPQCASVSFEVVPTDPSGEGNAAYATEPREGEFNLACVVVVYEDRWSAESACMHEMIMRHEDGHLLGLGHSQNPRNIMAHPIDRAVWCEAPQIHAEWVAQISRCRTFGPADVRRCWNWSRTLRNLYEAENQA